MTVPIHNVSDTARWVAVYRAMETDRPDAHFRDPYARKLAGEHGAQIVKTMKRGKQMAWPMIVRTQVLDEIIGKYLDQGIDTVVNLAAGLDARPWRMDLPYDLRWFDVDLPGILDYKLSVIGDEKAKCRYEALRVDLRDGDARRQAFAHIADGARKALVISEGLLIYLKADDVAALARDLHLQPSFRWWTSDLAAPILLDMMKKMWGKSVDAGDAGFQFAPAEGTEFFAREGWREVGVHYTMEDAIRLKRFMGPKWMYAIMSLITPRKKREAYRTMSSVIELERE